MVCLLGQAASPSTAEASYDEVIDPVTKKLTGPAKTILTNPTFLAEEPVVGAVAREGWKYRLAAGSGYLPAVGAFATGYTIGEGIRSICNAIISGCLQFEDDEEEMPIIGYGQWAFKRETESLWSTPSQVKLWPYSYCWAVTGTSCATAFRNPDHVTVTNGKGETEEKECYGYSWSQAFKPAVGSFITRQNSTCFGVPVKEGAYSKSATEAYRFTPGNAGSPVTGAVYCPVSATGKNLACTSTPSSDWAEKAAGILNDPAARGYPPADIADLEQHIASKINPNVKDPYKKYVTFPDDVCKVGAKVGPCIEELEELDLVPDVKELDWDEAVVEELDELDPEKTREEESEKIIVLPPVPNEVVTGTPVEIESNPKKKDMPVFLPIPDKGGGEDGEGEKPEEYKKRIAPIFIPNVEELDDGTYDPEVGPGRVSRTQPGSKTRFDPNPSPESRPEISIKTNPDTAPPATPAPGSPGGWSPPALRKIDPGPLTSIQSPCTAFPFGVLCWLGEGIGQFNTAGVCPHVAVPVSDDADFNLSLCGETSNTVMGYVRPFLLFAWIIGCGFLFAKATRAIGGA